MILSFSCNNKCPPSAIDFEPKSIQLWFSILDKDGNDLFFGENRIYDPYNVKFTGVVEEEKIPLKFSYVNEIDECFHLYGFYPKEAPYIFYVEFTPNKVDTIKIESYVIGWYEEPKGCRHFEIYKDDIFFNDILICTDYSREILKI